MSTPPDAEPDAELSIEDVRQLVAGYDQVMGQGSVPIRDGLVAAVTLAEQVPMLLDRIEALRAIADAATHYVNCPDSEAETGVPYDALVHAVRVHERQGATT